MDDKDTDFDATIVRLTLAEVAAVKNIEKVNSLKDVQHTFESAETIDEKQTIFLAHQKTLLKELRSKFGVNEEKVRSK